MFDTLSDRLGNVFDRLRGRGALSESDVRAAMREVRVALLEADVALPVARDGPVDLRAIPTPPAPTGVAPAPARVVAHAASRRANRA